MKLNIGSGFIGPDLPFAKEDWVNVDFAYEEGKPEWSNAKYMKFNLVEGWPIGHDTVDCIFASHIFEHFEYNVLQSVFDHCFRVLKEGYPIRIICPDPRIFVRNWRIENKQFLFDCYGQKNCERFEYEKFPHIGFSDMFFGEHYSHAVCPSIDTMMMMMIRTGFRSIEELNYGNTVFPEYFGDIGAQDYSKHLDNRPNMSWYLEGVK